MADEVRGLSRELALGAVTVGSLTIARGASTSRMEQLRDDLYGRLEKFDLLALTTNEPLVDIAERGFLEPPVV